MTYQLKELTEETRGLILGSTETAIKLFGLDADVPSKTVARIDDLVVRGQCDANTLLSLAPDEDVAVLLGAAWGDQLVGALGWSWHWVELNDEDCQSTVLAVVSPDLSMAIYPIDYVRAFLENPQVDCTIELAFNMLQAKSHPIFNPGEMTDFLSGVNRIVPR